VGVYPTSALAISLSGMRVSLTSSAASSAPHRTSLRSQCQRFCTANDPWRDFPDALSSSNGVVADCLPLQGDNGPRMSLILLEDIPHLHGPDQRQSLISALGHLARSSNAVCVLVHSDSALGDGKSALWLQSVCDLPGSGVMKVNRTAPRLLKKALVRIVGAAGHSISDEALKGVVASADGDIRSAVNALQMCLVRTRPLASRVRTRLRLKSA